MSSDDFTAKLALPYLLPNQAQKHVTLNESLRRLDTIVMAAIEGQNSNTPPDTPLEGEAWLIGESPEGAWEALSRRLTFWADGSWHFEQPQAGWRVFDKSIGRMILFDGSMWMSLGGETQNLDFLGLATIADETNPFAARLNTALFTAREAGDNGSGDLRLTLNKEAEGNVGSVLFQSGWTGRAECGLIGSDNFEIRLSGDGQNWTDCLNADAASGNVGIKGPPGANDALTVYGRFQATSSEGFFLLRDNGTLDMARHSGGAIYVRARSNGSTLNFGVTDSSGTLTNNALSVRPDQTDILFKFTPSPHSDASVDLGQAGRVWRDLYLQNAPTVSSDARGKLEIEDFQDPLRLVEYLRPVTYRRHGETRRHFGFVAQEVHEALKAVGLEDAALWTLSDPEEPASAQMLCQEELISVLVATVQRLIVRIENLETS